MTTQPLPLLAGAASPPPPRNRETTRLLHLWVELTRRAAEAAAHHSEDEAPLRHLQLQVEDALVEGLPGHDQLPAEMVAWEADLIHVAQTPPETCLICRKARLGLPADLPLPAAWGARP